MATKAINKSELINEVSTRCEFVEDAQVQLAVKMAFDLMTKALMNHQRIEVRGFGSFKIKHRPARISRNPKTGESIRVSDTYLPHFKPAKRLCERLNEDF